MDSGASCHMTPNRALLENLVEVTGKSIVTASGKKIPVLGTGRSYLLQGKSRITLKDVLYVPDLGVSLLSVGAIVKNGYDVEFKGDTCRINNSAGKLVLSVEGRNGMFKLVEANRKEDAGHCYLSGMNWHRKLGHVNVNTLKLMTKAVDGIKLNSTNGVEECKVCVKGKQTVQTCKKSEIKTVGINQLIHSDVMGPMRVKSIGGSVYALVFVDDYSRLVTVYFLKSKDEVAPKTVSHIKRIERQTERPVKIVVAF